MDNEKVSSELVKIAKLLTSRERIKTKGKFPNVEYIVGDFHFKCEEETVTVTKDVGRGVQSINHYSYKGKGKKDRGQRKPTEEADWEMAEESAYKMALKQSKA